MLMDRYREIMKKALLGRERFRRGTG